MTTSFAVIPWYMKSNVWEQKEAKQKQQHYFGYICIEVFSLDICLSLTEASRPLLCMIVCSCRTCART